MSTGDEHQDDLSSLEEEARQRYGRREQGSREGMSDEERRAGRRAGRGPEPGETPESRRRSGRDEMTPDEMDEWAEGDEFRG
ncbi:hypothetical protein [Streptomyces sp. JJ36]|uniref:hypothetical protein n=1 Tax=Streptomyces sp. JJ36 TaxID=2736645 RepID=UPI001F1DED84|nr:hypothetical protein [Streptomyces sp. JJ36]MCF6522277.1 hypothetical protein [Streptomyces sp. JJ36]